jgi:hypothetical protein
VSSEVRQGRRESSKEKSKAFNAECAETQRRKGGERRRKSKDRSKAFNAEVAEKQRKDPEKRGERQFVDVFGN